ncbi:MAG: ankyrin repeat domain-containing protein [Steroidobacteraceae bacterium]
MNVTRLVGAIAVVAVLLPIPWGCANTDCLPQSPNLAAEIVREQYLTEEFQQILGEAKDGDRRLQGHSRAYYLAATGNLARLREVTEECANLPTDASDALIVAAQVGELRIVEFLLDECRIPIDSSLGNGATALMVAAEAGETIVLEALLRRGADPLRKNDRQSNALHHAIAFRQVATVKLLLSSRPELLSVDAPNGVSVSQLAENTRDRCTIDAVRAATNKH